MVVGSMHDYRVLSSAPGRHAVSWNGRVIGVRTARDPHGVIWVAWRGRTRQVRPVMDEDLQYSEATRREDKPGAVTPPTPAVVARVLVKAGDTVVRGQPLVVVSAMKMETTLQAPRDGVVRAVCTAVGSQVRPGDTLVIVGPGGET